MLEFAFATNRMSHLVSSAAKEQRKRQRQTERERGRERELCKVLGANPIQIHHSLWLWLFSGPISVLFRFHSILSLVWGGLCAKEAENWPWRNGLSLGPASIVRRVCLGWWKCKQQLRVCVLFLGPKVPLVPREGKSALARVQRKRLTLAAFSGPIQHRPLPLWAGSVRFGSDRFVRNAR